ncbi:glutamate transport system substrate-binding protein [Saccharothrix tamanrassetensis]|uniref:Glutamate transport system substrate-binding protein n=1 Tax=Saccharothrix tamanrassetensis TaxID=1051531 RepID=A0A841CVI6_9PSEU|nr:transporter substrate-binding domain-containing protein [Saccharothrix tamanrassetensis]MBB5959406.1 glutamate transport system substrate-binding protein [Saccharothrix tamanrassetensis]
MTTNRVAAALVALVALAACTAPPAQQPARSADPKPASHPVNVGVGTDIPGMAVFDPKSHVRRGFDVDLYQWLGNNTEPKFTPVEVDVLVPHRVDALVAGEVELVVHVFSITDERRLRISFAGPYLVTQQGVMVRQGDKRIETIDDLAGKTVCAQTDSTSYAQLNSGSLKGKVTTTTDDSTRGCVDRLLRQEVDAASTDELVLRGFAQQTPGLEVLDLRFGTKERYGIGLPKGDRELCERMTEGIRTFITNGLWDQFFRTNFGDIPSETYRPDPYRLDPCT